MRHPQPAYDDFVSLRFHHKAARSLVGSSAARRIGFTHRSHEKRRLGLRPDPFAMMVGTESQPTKPIQMTAIFGGQRRDKRRTLPRFSPSEDVVELTSQSLLFKARQNSNEA